MLYEQPSEAGVAHFLEHLVVRAAMEASNSSFLRCLSSHAHHETALTHTVFPFQISQPREILEAFNLYGLIADRKLVIKESQVKAERKVIAMEYKENVQDKITCAGDKLHCSLVEGAFSCETCLNNLMHIDSTMVNDFYQKWYISSQMALLIIGNFDAKELFTIARQSFSGEKPDVGIPVTIKDQSWTSELIIVKDAANALAFKLGRSSNLRETWVWNMIVNAIDKRLKDSCQGFAYIVEKELSTFIMLASYVNVEELVYENLRLLEWGLTSSEVEREQNEIRKSLRRNATLFQLDKDYQIRVLQTKLRDHFLFDEKLMSPILEVEESQEQISLDIRDYLKPFEIARARIYLKGPSFRSRDSLIATVKKRSLAPWDDTKKLVNFDEHWKCDNQ